MIRQITVYLALVVTILMAVTGCHPLQPTYVHDSGPLTNFLDRQLEIEYPDVETASLPESTDSLPPLTIGDPEFQQFWDLTLEEVVSTTLQNSKVIRNLGGVTPIGFADGLVQRTGNATIYDPALTATSPSGLSAARPGPGLTIGGDQANRITAQSAGGVESALGAFDAQVAMLGTSVDGGTGLYSKSDRPLNTTGAFPGFPFVTQATDGGLRFDLAKKSASGATFGVAGVTSYDNSNRRGTFQALDSTWTQFLEAKAEVHLLQGRGTQINRIPIVLARINEDISLSQFEISIRNLVLDVENTYWDLQCAFRSLEAAKQGRDAAQWAWEKTQARRQGEVDPADAEAQAREQYYSFMGRVQQAQQLAFDVENRLRFLMGNTVADGRFIRPIDDPTLAKVQFEWHEIVCEALLRRPELRQQKWSLKQRELELIAAKNRLLPILDVGADYRWLGVGDHLINAHRNGINFPNAGSTAFDELTEGNYQEFDVFMAFAMPVGYRRELAAVRNAQLQLVRTKAVLEDIELNTTHNLGTAWRNLDANYHRAQTNLNRLEAADRWVEVVSNIWAQGGSQGRDPRLLVNQLLNAINARAQAYDDYYRTICEYNKAIANLHFNKGSLLDYNGVQLAEGPWPEKAYWDAQGRARERNASYYLNYGWTRPDVVSRGPVEQHSGASGSEFAPQPLLPGEPGEIIADETITPVEPSTNEPTPAAPQHGPAETGQGANSAPKAESNSGSSDQGSDEPETSGKVPDAGGKGGSTAPERTKPKPDRSAARDAGPRLQPASATQLNPAKPSAASRDANKRGSTRSKRVTVKTTNARTSADKRGTPPTEPHAAAADSFEWGAMGLGKSARAETSPAPANSTASTQPAEGSASLPANPDVRIVNPLRTATYDEPAAD